MDLVISHVYKDFGRGPVLRDVSLTVRQGETVCLMGPSGLGKTTLAGIIAAFLQACGALLIRTGQRIVHWFISMD